MLDNFQLTLALKSCSYFAINSSVRAMITLIVFLTISASCNAQLLTTKVNKVVPEDINNVLENRSLTTFSKEKFAKRMSVPNCRGDHATVFNGTLDVLRICTQKTCLTISQLGERKEPGEINLCVAVCVAQSMGLMNAAGNIDVSKLYQIFEVAQTTENSVDSVSIVKSCALQHEASILLKPGNCNSASLFLTCAIDGIFQACGYPFEIVYSVFKGKC